jgi:hypothetical protein
MYHWQPILSKIAVNLSKFNKEGTLLVFHGVPSRVLHVERLVRGRGPQSFNPLYC